MEMKSTDAWNNGRELPHFLQQKPSLTSKLLGAVLGGLAGGHDASLAVGVAAARTIARDDHINTLRVELRSLDAQESGSNRVVEP